MNFVVGNNYGNRTAIKALAGGNQQHGITFSKTKNEILLFSNKYARKEKKSKNIYSDRFLFSESSSFSGTGSTADYLKVDRCLYAGIGRLGDQRDTANRNKYLNEAVQNHKKENKKILLFRSVKKGRIVTFIFMGVFNLSRTLFEYQNDDKKKERIVYVFDLKKDSSFTEYEIN